MRSFFWGGERGSRHIDYHITIGVPEIGHNSPDISQSLKLSDSRRQCWNASKDYVSIEIILNPLIFLKESVISIINSQLRDIMFCGQKKKKKALRKDLFSRPNFPTASSLLLLFYY